MNTYITGCSKLVHNGLVCQQLSHDGMQALKAIGVKHKEAVKLNVQSYYVGFHGLTRTEIAALGKPVALAPNPRQTSIIPWVKYYDRKRVEKVLGCSLDAISFGVELSTGVNGAAAFNCLDRNLDNLFPHGPIDGYDGSGFLISKVAIKGEWQLMRRPYARYMRRFLTERGFQAKVVRLVNGKAAV